MFRYFGAWGWVCAVVGWRRLRRVSRNARRDIWLGREEVDALSGRKDLNGRYMCEDCLARCE